jgi:pyridinium-3,5-biscarboxylic acid mononucleotide sulfurtransferase
MAITDVVSARALEKEERLKTLLSGYGAIAIAYSGGVDSTYLADVAHEVLAGGARMILADSPSLPRSELDEATQIARARGWNLTIIATREFANETFLKNDEKRCYICKNELFTRMREYATRNNVAVLAYGETADDTVDQTRVGKIAAGEHKVVAPLMEVRLVKDEIRELSRQRGLPTWNKASFACLSSRIPVGTRLTLDALERIERAEELLKILGFRQYRARHHGDLCRIEIAVDDFDRIMETDTRDRIVSALRSIGYRHVTLDLAGYRTGSTAALPTSSRQERR